MWGSRHPDGLFNDTQENRVGWREPGSKTYSGISPLPLEKCNHYPKDACWAPTFSARSGSSSRFRRSVAAARRSD